MHSHSRSGRAFPGLLALVAAAAGLAALACFPAPVSAQTRPSRGAEAPAPRDGDSPDDPEVQGPESSPPDAPPEIDPEARGASGEERGEAAPPPDLAPPSAEAGPPEAEAGALPARPGGILQKVARTLLGPKDPGRDGDRETDRDGEAATLPGAEDEAGGAESRENVRRSKELVRLALQNIEKKRISEAKKNLNDLITLKPYEADYHLALGLCFRQEKRFKDAQKKYQDVLDLGGPKSLVNLLMAEVAAEAGEKDKVFEHLKEAAVGGRNIIHDVQNLPLLDRYKADTEFIKLALYLEKFEVLSRRVQDPFTNPFPASQPSAIPRGQAPVPQGAVSLTPQDQQNLLAEARRLYEKIQWYIKLEDEDKAMENYMKLREIVDKKDLLTLPKIINDFRILVSRMEHLETQIEGIRLKYYWNQANARLKDLKEAFQATEYHRVDQLCSEVEKLSREMERANIRFKPVAERILVASRVWLNRANIRREFQSQKPEIQGVVIAYDTKLAIIENRVFKQGETFGEFHIQKVENNRVTFRYKGEEIPLIFRRY